MEEFVSLIIDPSVMDEANDATSKFLKPPAHARKNAKSTTWVEQFDVVGASVAAVENDPESPEKNGRVRIGVQFSVSPESEFQDNVGRQFFSSYLINYGQIKVKNSKERMMSLLSIGRLNNLLRAAGFEIDGGQGVDYSHYFAGSEDEQAAVIGGKVFGKLKQYVDKNGDERQDITQFDSLEAGQEG